MTEAEPRDALATEPCGHELTPDDDDEFDHYPEQPSDWGNFNPNYPRRCVTCRKLWSEHSDAIRAAHPQS